MDLKIFTENIDGACLSQVYDMAKSPIGRNQKIRIMPDCHAGKGCVVGTTMTITDKVVPNIVGVDIGCGMLTVKIAEKNIDLVEFDKLVNDAIPHGMGICRKINTPFDLKQLIMFDSLYNTDRLELSIGSLGGGNHFIELAKDEEGFIYLIIHSGSRNLGQQVAKFYQEKAKNHIRDVVATQVSLLIEKLKKENRIQDIEEEKQKIYNTYRVEESLTFLEGQEMQNYIHDMKITQEFASENRKAIAAKLLKNLTEIERFETIHNYIDIESMIIRKGAISAHLNEQCLIPINMRDGSLLCVGKGNADWNYSAPHGAGRIFSRSQAKKVLDLDEFKAEMSNVYSTSVGQSTLDEAPGAYKPMQEIVDNIQDTVEIKKRLKPIYNFKSK